MKLTVKQAAARGGVSAQLIYQLCEQRRLRHYRVGGRQRPGSREVVGQEGARSGRAERHPTATACSPAVTPPSLSAASA
jgi:excisionase family DNA binding protein